MNPAPSLIKGGIRVRNHISKYTLAASVSMITLGAATAQEAAQPVNASGAEAAQTRVMDQVVVNAQRRDERLVDVPISVSVASGEQLKQAGITNSADLKLVTPALNLTQQGSFVQPTIRGVGTSVVGPGADGNVALYVDGVYQATQAAALFELNAIDSIEVLKGPQGSLFGRNATGGAIVVTTAAPEFDFSGRVTGSYGNFNDRRLSGYITGPITDKIAANLAVLYHEDDGYVTNVATGSDLAKTNAYLARGKILVEATEDLSLTFTGSYVKHENNAAFSYIPVPENFRYVTSDAYSLGVAGSRDEASMDFNPYSQLEGGSLSINAVYDADWATITSTTSYTQQQQPFYTDTDGTELPIQEVHSPQDQDTFVQEVTFASNSDGDVSWIFGGMYYDDETESYGTVYVNNTPVAVLVPNVQTEAAAAFAEVTFSPTERLHLLLGGRYNTETKTFMGRVGGRNGPIVANDDEKWDSFTPRASIRYELSDQSSVYLTYSEGFKSGLYNATSLDPAPVDPEEIKSYEVGYKHSGSTFLFTGAAYFYDYTGIQVNAIDQSRGGFVTVTNAGNAEIYGADFDLSFPITDELSARTGASYIHGEYNDFPGAIVYIPEANGMGYVQVNRDVSGNRIMKTPEYTAFGTLLYTRPISQTGEIQAALTVSYNDGWYWDPSNTSEQDGYTQINARLSWAPNDRFTVTAYGQNISDEKVEIFRRTGTMGDLASYNRPASYGVELDLKF